MNRRSERVAAYIAELEARVRDVAKANRRERERAQRAESERDELAAQAEPKLYVARTVSGRTLYEGTHELAAIAAARAHFARHREHVTIDGSAWSTRKRGGVRR